MILVLLLVVVLAAALAVTSMSRLRGFVSKHAMSGHSHWCPLTHEETHQWVSTKRAAIDTDEEQLPLIKAYVVLKENTAGLRTMQESIKASSNPTCPNHYGHHLEWEELNALVAPSKDDMAQVTQWLKHASVKHWEVMASCSWVRIATSAKALEALVKCHIRAFTPHKDLTKSERIIIQWCEEEVYKILCHLDHIVDFMTPIVGMLHPHLPIDCVEANQMLLHKPHTVSKK